MQGLAYGAQALAEGRCSGDVTELSCSGRREVVIYVQNKSKNKRKKREGETEKQDKYSGLYVRIQTLQ